MSEDFARTLRLLWRESGTTAAPGRGPKPGLSVDRIVAAAVELADAEGLAALSMRKVATHLGTSPMSLYTYVPGKAELLELMVDATGADLLHDGGLPTPWRAAMERLAADHWALYARHPWLPEVLSSSRPVLGPNVTAGYEQALVPLDGIGLTDVEMDSVVVAVTDHVVAAARRAAEARAARETSGMTELEWWEANAPVLAEVFDASRYPVSVRVGAAAGEAHGAAYSPEHAFSFGLARLLDGVEALVTGRSASPGPASG